MHLKNRELKLFIVSSPCCGKSTFVKNCDGYYQSIKILDFERIPAIRIGSMLKRKFSFPWKEKWTHKIILSTLRRSREPLCVLVGEGPPNPRNYDDIIFAVVLIPEQKAQEYCSLRKSEFPHHQWSDWNKVKRVREKVSEYAISNSLPVYSDFTSAIEEPR